MSNHTPENKNINPLVVQLAKNSGVGSFEVETAPGVDLNEHQNRLFAAVLHGINDVEGDLSEIMLGLVKEKDGMTIFAFGYTTVDGKSRQVFAKCAQTIDRFQLNKFNFEITALRNLTNAARRSFISNEIDGDTPLFSDSNGIGLDLSQEGAAFVDIEYISVRDSNNEVVAIMPAFYGSDSNWLPGDTYPILYTLQTYIPMHTMAELRNKNIGIAAKARIYRQIAVAYETLWSLDLVHADPNAGNLGDVSDDITSSKFSQVSALIDFDTNNSLIDGKVTNPKTRMSFAKKFKLGDKEVDGFAYSPTYLYPKGFSNLDEAISMARGLFLVQLFFDLIPGTSYIDFVKFVYNNYAQEDISVWFRELTSPTPQIPDPQKLLKNFKASLVRYIEAKNPNLGKPADLEQLATQFYNTLYYPSKNVDAGHFSKSVIELTKLILDIFS